MHKIHSNTRIKPHICRMIVEAPYVAEHRRAGQFIILRIDERGERIPLTIADADPGGDHNPLLPDSRNYYNEVI